MKSWRLRSGNRRGGVIAILLALIPGSFSPSGFACMNTFDYDPAADRRLDGKTTGRSLFPVEWVDPTSPFHKKLAYRWKTDLDMLEKRTANSSDFKSRSDYAVGLTHNGKSAEALTILLEIEQNHPKEYAIASNLGTAYELIGDNHNAKRWIEEAIARHANSHDGTEWLHVLILDAKIALEKDPHWLKDHSILGIDFGSAKAPRWPDGLENDPVQTDHMIKALRYQLRERVQFVQPTDAVVASLLFDLGNLVALKETIANGKGILEIAARYDDGIRADLIRKRVSYLSTYQDGAILGTIRRHPFAFFIMNGLLALCLIRLNWEKLKTLFGRPDWEAGEPPSDQRMA